MSEPVPVAVVGAGRLGSIHARILAAMPEAELVAVVDIDAERAAEVAARHGARALTRLDQIEGVEACVVAVPTVEHHPVASRLMMRGLSCLVEKPIATTVAEAEDLCRIARDREVTLMVGHSERFNPVMRALEKLPFEARFIDSQRVSPFSFRSADIGVVLDMMIHDIDIILHLVKSPVKAVHAVGVPVIGRNEDLANARIVFENGAVANATASRVALKTERTVRVFSGELYATLDFAKKEGRIIRRGPALESGELDIEAALEEGMRNPLAFMQKGMVTIETLGLDDVEPLLAENRAFLAAHRTKTAPPVTGEDGLVALDCACRIVASARENAR
ncbi:MAG: Gfo/Idh/MocA family oxidoreductase [Planctomycetes bacterium]|nr:Gfo/Idh/MocA family oxidoreductase [Planctomycetota bacterium]